MPINMLNFGNPIASRGVSSPAVAVSVTLATMIAMPTIRIVCYTSNAFQVVPTSAPMNVLTLGNSIASREVISPAVAVSVAFGRWLRCPLLVCRGYTLKTFQVVPKPTDPSSYLVHDIDLVGEFKQGLSMCIFSAIHAFTIILHFVALRLRGRRHEFFVVRFLLCACLVNPPSRMLQG